tara:strand:+ start:113 stop:1117 length:1005 start_codon:yes stop_codon:yes gene_type:complete
MNILKTKIFDKFKPCIPIWFMRQAGRHLPEFRKIRSKNSNFIKLCLNSDLSSKLTLQPIKRYDLDFAIIFSDILMVPYALGQHVSFIKNYGPVLSDFNLYDFLNNNKQTFSKDLKPVYKAITKTKKKLKKGKKLISFIGAPWTLLIYMMDLKENGKIKKSKIKNLKNTKIILDQLNKYLCLHIKNQVKAGADIIQIFDSWAGLIPSKDLKRFCYEPNSKLVKFCKSNNIPVICFPKGIKKKYKNFNSIVKPDGLSLDYEIDPNWAKFNLTNVVLQGGLDPQILFKSEKIIYAETKKYLDIFKDVPYIFNLGHGLDPKTSISKLKKLIKFVKNYK